MLNNIYATDQKKKYSLIETRNKIGTSKPINKILSYRKEIYKTGVILKYTLYINVNYYQCNLDISNHFIDRNIF